MCQSQCNTMTGTQEGTCCRSGHMPLSKSGRVRMYESHLEKMKEKMRDLEAYIEELKQA